MSMAADQDGRPWTRLVKPNHVCQFDINLNINAIAGLKTYI